MKQWEVHVLVRRPWMDQYLHLVERAIMQPTLVFRDKEFPRRECFYLACAREFVDEFLKVVIEYNEDNDGRVITAFAHQDSTAGETRIWPT